MKWIKKYLELITGGIIYISIAIAMIALVLHGCSMSEKGKIYYSRGWMTLWLQYIFNGMIIILDIAMLILFIT